MASHNMQNPAVAPPPYEIIKRRVVDFQAPYATLPTSNPRYSRDYRVNRIPFIIPVTQSLSSYSRSSHKACSPGWLEHTHPEGSPFFYDSHRHLITDNDVNDPNITALLFSAHLTLVQTARECSIDWDNCDLCLSINAEDESCGYYFVDHSAKSIFHVEDVTSDDLGLPEASSPMQIRHLLREQYWCHVEFFPSIRNLQQAKGELESTLAYGTGDHLTSDNSTFPYDKAQCWNMLKLLRSPSLEGSTETWFIARMSAVIARHHYDTFYAEQHARLSCEQRRLDYTAPRQTRTSRLLTTAVLNFGEPIRKEMDLLYADELVYTLRWRKFIASRLADWKECCALSMCLLGLGFGGFLLTTSELARASALLVTTLAFGSLVSSTALRCRYSDGEQYHAADIVDHIRSLSHPVHGYDAAAAMLALPRAFQAWSMIAVTMHLLISAMEFMSLGLLFVICISFLCVGGLLLTMVSTLSPEVCHGGPVTSIIAFLRSQIRKRRTSKDDSPV